MLHFKIVCVLFVILTTPVIGLMQGHDDWSYNLNIYQVNTRNYTSTGTFGDFASHLDRLQDLGVGIIYFMPVHPIGQQNRLGSLGSPYSVYDYRSINPEFGTMEDFTTLVQAIHARGMYVIMDWVPNHTSWDNPLTVAHPEWYVTDDHGNFTSPPGTNWSDVIQLDYSSDSLRKYMIESMAYWVKEADIDGFRCDAVSFTPLDFWSSAIDTLKAIKPELLLLAEDDGTQYKTVGFDMSYAWGYHGFGDGIIKRIVNGFSDATALDFYLISEWYHYYPEHIRMYFTSNHDENAWHGTVFEQFGVAAETFSVLTGLLPGMQLIYGGQEAGLDKRLAFFDKDAIAWRDHPFGDMYTTLLQLKRKNRALWNGESGGPIRKVTTNNDKNTYAFIREKEEDCIFSVFNLSSEIRTVTFTDSIHLGSYLNVFTGDTVSYVVGSQITLDPWAYRVHERLNRATAVDGLLSKPENPHLFQNYPNPFNTSTVITFKIPDATMLSFSIYDIHGAKVLTRTYRSQITGFQSIYWDGKDEAGTQLSTGVYFARLSVGDYSESIKMLYLK